MPGDCASAIQHDYPRQAAVRATRVFRLFEELFWHALQTEKVSKMVTGFCQ